MTAGLQGSGTEVDPWLISSVADAAAVLRDAVSSGYYALTTSVTFTIAQMLPVVSGSIAATYAPKVVDLRGYSLQVFGDTTYLSGVVINVHFRNGTLYLRARVSGSPSAGAALYGCGLTDVRLRLDRGWAAAGVPTMSGKIFDGRESLATLIPRVITRVMVQWQTTDDPIPTANAWTGGFGGTVAEFYSGVADVIVRRTSTAGWVDSGISAAVTLWEAYGIRLTALPEAQFGRFSAAGWWDDLTTQGIYPYQAVVHALLVNTFSEGVPVSRAVWVESIGRRVFLGYTDGSGVGSWSAHVRKGAPLVVSASEGYLTDLLRSHAAIVAGRRYLVPGVAGRVYVPNVSGSAGDLSGVVFADSPVTANGITYTPVTLYRTVASDLLGGVGTAHSYTVNLDTSSGGGGPVIDGDPAYLEGLVEEVHPMTGLRRALANCEVVAFERRGSDYVAMGNTWSDGIGGFRLETQVYGGGDVFAFAADFPGVIFQPGAALAIGDRVRPALANGYVYEIVQAGTAGAAEPVWWPDQGDGTEGDIGTARARARPYYQPVGHGPLKMIPM